MSGLFRFSISMEKRLLEKFDCLIRETNYTNRSEAIRDLIRQQLVRKQWKEGKEVAGAVILIYDHHKRELIKRLIDIQHDFKKMIISAQHIHLDHNNCLEIITIKGNPHNSQRLANILKSIKGIKHATLSMSSTGKDII